MIDINKKNIYTDLAIENRELYNEVNQGQPDGVLINEEQMDEISISRVEIINDIGAKALQKPIGKYITITLPEDKTDESRIITEASIALEKELISLVGKNISQPAMICGLGNWGITPDSLGPKVAEGIEITRHIIEAIPEDLKSKLRPVCCITPGVLGITGVETAEIVKGTLSHVRPAFLIAIDSLAGRKMNRIANTIQISNTGINPGAGIGNHRNVLSQETLGCPVIAIGVPTVVSARTMVMDYADKDDETLNEIIVTPKDIDEIIDFMAEIIAHGINHALHEAEVFA